MSLQDALRTPGAAHASEHFTLEPDMGSLLDERWIEAH